MNILVPTSWSDVTVNQYQALANLNKDDYKSDFKYMVDVIQILCNLDTSFDLPLSVVNQISEEITFTTKEPKVKRFESFEIGDNTYNWVGNFNQITVGEALSIEQTIDLGNLNFNQSYDVVMSVLLRKNNKPFQSSEFNKNRAEFGELPVTMVLGMLFFFLNGGQIYTKDMQTYSITLMKTSTNTHQKSKKLKMQLLKRIRKVLRLNG